MGVRVKNLINWDAARAWLEGIASGTARKAAEFTADRAGLYCPVDTGFLRSKIEVVKMDGRHHFAVIVACEYAAPVHDGYYVSNQYGKSGTFVVGRPFLANATHDASTAFPRITADAVVAISTGAIVAGINR